MPLGFERLASDEFQPVRDPTPSARATRPEHMNVGLLSVSDVIDERKIASHIGFEASLAIQIYPDGSINGGVHRVRFGPRRRILCKQEIRQQKCENNRQDPRCAWCSLDQRGAPNVEEHGDDAVPRFVTKTVLKCSIRVPDERASGSTFPMPDERHPRAVGNTQAGMSVTSEVLRTHFPDSQGVCLVSGRRVRRETFLREGACWI